MSGKTATIQDRNGDVWTGQVVDDSSLLEEIAGNVVGMGIPALAGSTGSSTTVKVNGEKHTGKKVK
jgi:hypothetical protein